MADRPTAAERTLVAATRERIRTFLSDELEHARFTPTADSWMHSLDPDFSQRLAAAGFVGTTIPVEYGGRGGTEIERFAIAEELVAAGAPVAAHWIAERQLAPLLVRFGTDEQRKRLLPGIARGEVVFSIGMSEPDAGSDLAAVRTRASWAGDGWVLTGRKIWTTNAHIASVMVVLARSDGEHGDRHEGLSQFVVDLPARGVSVQPIRTLDGAHHFNEVTLDNVRLSTGSLLGERGRGWEQVNSELSFERSGPERFLSMVPLLRAWVAALPDRPGELERVTLGRLTARLAALRRMSFILVWSLQHDRHDVARMAASVKLLGNAFEKDVVESISGLIDRVAAPPEELIDLLDQAMVAAPAVSLRGGTSEILRTIVARSLAGS
jgi:alkylation response protein AidB-like acyl-CoA dehydrogenase